jgi:WD40 repeat protein
VKLCFTPDGAQLAVSSGSYSAPGLIDLARKRQQSLCADESGTAVAFTPDGKRVAYFGQKRPVHVRAFQDHKLLRVYEEHPDPVRIAFSPDGKLLAAAGYKGLIVIWDARGPVPKQLPNVGDSISVIQFSPDSRVLAIGVRGSVLLFELSTGQRVGGPLAFRTPGGEESPTWSVSFSPDGKHLVAGGNEVVRVWEVPSGKVVRTFTERDMLSTQAVFDPTGQGVLVGTDSGGAIRRWPLEDWLTRLRRRLLG